MLGVRELVQHAAEDACRRGRAALRGSCEAECQRSIGVARHEACACGRSDGCERTELSCKLVSHGPASLARARGRLWRSLSTRPSSQSRVFSFSLKHGQAPVGPHAPRAAAAHATHAFTHCADSQAQAYMKRSSNTPQVTSTRPAMAQMAGRRRRRAPPAPLPPPPQASRRRAT
jgi:hypothetical protein